jgi:regulatory protein
VNDLERYAARYLKRYTTTRPHLKRLMRRRVQKVGGNPSEIDPLLDRLEEMRLLDDVRWARDKAASLARRGTSHRGIRAKLGAKGLFGDVVDQALAALGDTELASARGYARKRRLGDWGEHGADRERRQKDLAKLARRGFSYGIATEALKRPAD